MRNLSPFQHDPVVMSRCYKIPRVIIEAKPKPIIEISSRLRFLSYAIFEAYTSEDGKHVDYRSIHGSEEFARFVGTFNLFEKLTLMLNDLYAFNKHRWIYKTLLALPSIFFRYLRIIEELQRVELQNISREEKLAFFINLFNMMAIHAILILGHPPGALE